MLLMSVGCRCDDESGGGERRHHFFVKKFEYMGNLFYICLGIEIQHLASKLP